MSILSIKNQIDYEVIMIIGYCRVSSKVQLDRYGLEVQSEEIKSRYADAIIYQEQHTGTKMDRPILNKLIDGKVLPSPVSPENSRLPLFSEKVRAYRRQV